MPIKSIMKKQLSFPEIGRIRKGKMESKQKGNKTVKYPVDLDYFRVEFHEGQEETAALFFDLFGEKPDKIDITLPFNDIVQCWDAWMEAYTASRMIAKSEGPGEADDPGYVQYRCDPKTGAPIVVNGINVESGEPEIHPEDNIAGYDMNGNPVEYKPRGRLKVVVPKLQRVAYLLLQTGSWHDIHNIDENLEGLKKLNDGTIRGIPLILMRKDKEVMAPIGDTRQRVTKSLIFIEANPDWVAARMAADMRDSYPELPDGTRGPEPLPSPVPPKELQAPEVIDEGTPTQQEQVPPKELQAPEVIDEGTPTQQEQAPPPEVAPEAPTGEESVDVPKEKVQKYANITRNDGEALSKLAASELIEYMENLEGFLSDDELPDTKRAIAEFRLEAAQYYLGVIQGS